MKTRFLLIMALSLFVPFHLFSQEQKAGPDQKTLQPQQVPQQQQGLKRVYELGLRFIDLNNFGFDFKVGNQKTLYRLSLLAVDLSSTKSSGTIHDSTVGPSTQSYGASLRIGIEKRIFLAKNFYLHLGSDVGINYNYTQINGNVVPYPDSRWSRWELSPAIYINVGLAYQAGEHFIVTAEFSPSVQYYVGTEKQINAQYGPNYENTFHRVGFALTTGTVSITVAYRILKTILFKW